jgi:phosphoribosylformylglycinamidine (FGAM) synthase PurS component
MSQLLAQIVQTSQSDAKANETIQTMCEQLLSTNHQLDHAQP